MSHNTPKISFAPHQSWGGLIVGVSARISLLGADCLKRAGLGHLSYGRIGVLSVLLNGECTQAQLCRELRQAAPSMSEMLKRLHGDGFVKFMRRVQDSRKIHWQLTPKGKRDILRVKKVFKKTGRLIDKTLTRLEVSAHELARFKGVLAGFIKELSVQGGFKPKNGSCRIKVKREKRC